MYKVFLLSIAILCSLSIKAQWQLVSPYPTTNEFFSISFKNDTGFIVGNCNTVFNSLDLGESWSGSKIDSTVLSELLTSVVQISGKEAFVVGYNGIVYHTNNNGFSWLSQTINNEMPMYSLENISFPSSNVGYIVGTNKKVYKTINKGIQWIDISNKIEDYEYYFFNSSYFINNNIGFVFGMFGKIFITTNGGNDFDLLPKFTQKAINCLFFKNEMSGFAGCDDGLYKTDDLAIHWNKVNLGYEASIFSLFFIDEFNGYALGTEKISMSINKHFFLRTYDSGDTWIRLDIEYDLGNANVLFTDINTGFIVGRRGLILKTSNGGLLSNNNLNPKINSNLIFLYPNPASDVIYFMVKEPGNISIYDASGALVQSSSVVNKNTQYILPLTNYSKGMYFIGFIGKEKGKESVKFVKK